MSNLQENAPALPDPNSVLFKHDRLYRHQLFRTNYTTYDIRRSQDVVHAASSHCNIMVLADLGGGGISESNHPFRYARVEGIYHVNVVYVGAGMVNYEPRRMEFLWVRWYRLLDTTGGWSTQKLDALRFMSVRGGDAFGFIDPADVLRGCHIIPSFANGLFHVDGKGLSHSARDSSDWVRYYVDR